MYVWLLGIVHLMPLNTLKYSSILWSAASALRTQDISMAKLKTKEAVALWRSYGIRGNLFTIFL